LNDPLFDVTGKVIFVAGGACGIGSSLSHELALRGARILIADRLTEKGQQVLKGLPGKGHSFLDLDVTNYESVESAFDDTRARLGRIDVLLNSVGIANIEPALALSVEDFEKTMVVNVTGAFALSKAAGRVMQQQGEGRIIHLASVSSRVVNKSYAAYSSSKAALSQLVRILALEWATQGITVNAIGPAMTQTPMTERQLMASQDSREQALKKIPIGRFGTPEDLFGLILLLASPAGAFITGQTIFVDGGRTLL
jgi:NAD(P)-dependent dehydrogenase (short-subunit alcohol dehydrogenase family)